MRDRNTRLQASLQLLTPTEASAVLGVPEKTLAHWRTERNGPLAIHVGARVRYRLSDVEEWIGGRVEEARRMVVAPIGRPRPPCRRWRRARPSAHASRRGAASQN